jgi:hypothetical protein
MEEGAKRQYDLEERLLDYGARIITVSRSLSADYAEKHVGNEGVRNSV